MYNRIIVVLFFILIFIVKHKNTKAKLRKDHIQKLVRQAARWSVAAQQDESPIIALLHANYGAGYLWALLDIASDVEIYRSTGINIKKFTKKITDIQDQTTKRVSAVCPKFKGNLDSYLLQLGGDE